MRAFKLWIAAVALLGVAALAALGVGLYLYFSPEHAVRRVLEFERRLAGLARKEATLPDGLSYVYLEGGKGEPLMLLHGFGANKDNFVRVAKYLTPHYRVVIPDHAGFGESAKPPQADYSPRAQADRLRQLARELGMPKLHLGGNSMGGHIALTYAALYPGEVQSLWLLAPGGIWSAPPSEMRKRIEGSARNPMIVRSEEEFAQLVAGVTAVPLPIPRRFLDVVAQERIRNAELEERIFRQLAQDAVEPRVRALATPALIVWGAQDRVLHPGSAGILQMLLTRSEVVLMQGVGHLPMFEQPERSALDYLQFRAKL
ncbi:MAG TPA: alpha/beta hydrolase [Burkholderiales bacterium]